MQLAGRNAIVTGGARGIGASVVRAYVAEGARVVSLDVLDEQGRALVAELEVSHPGQALFHHCDIADKAQVNEAFRLAVDWLGGLDILANVAAVERTAPAEHIEQPDWNLIFDVNVRGTLHTNQAAFPHLKDRGGRIINFGSAAGLGGMPGAAHYAASKGAVLAWTRTLAQEWARHRITVNAVAPMIWTPMHDAHRAKMSVDELAAHDQMMNRIVPLGGKLGDAEQDLAPLMVFLAGQGSRFITGQTLCVDGGTVPVR
ncbi:SDR family oxidoreductase [Pseudomonas aeruginosa]|uniref:SDR family NAD(P)-dependent oxidoreductase n=1 Tax=Pseudomonas aeruginosa TaxID=287 RepID=UPI00071B8C72|nr:SDR family NAD(P)-dependent oxidoreductase [Pseudomonas aeruginosa]KSQ25035.1 short-chain dehydrogenase [Pseudomonas aeruginosa]MCO1687904.1 SDR family oxidoreductase [Pseudomonas aeruginosa]MCO1778594.1 SDR family oxidoreductase [Pseudomonas aeruginosa]MCO1790097.1 SDR family oxidoreductase [Pseudomonas aeruginosa]MCO1799340.1 SDR family oxidoreductase [Pseudomonas aeruginosa]